MRSLLVHNNASPKVGDGTFILMHCGVLRCLLRVASEAVETETLLHRVGLLARLLPPPERTVARHGPRLPLRTAAQLHLRGRRPAKAGDGEWAYGCLFFSHPNPSHTATSPLTRFRCRSPGHADVPVLRGVMDTGDLPTARGGSGCPGAAGQPGQRRVSTPSDKRSHFCHRWSL